MIPPGDRRAQCPVTENLSAETTAAGGAC